MKFNITIKLNDFEGLKSIANSLIKSKKKIFAFSGQLGSGKTTLIKELLMCLGEKKFEGSPTFAIIQYYQTQHEIYHIDSYRIENEHESLNLGLEELFTENAYFFIEWPEKISQFLPDDIIWVYIRIDETNNRQIEYSL